MVADVAVNCPDLMCWPDSREVTKPTSAPETVCPQEPDSIPEKAVGIAALMHLQSNNVSSSLVIIINQEKSSLTLSKTDFKQKSAEEINAINWCLWLSALFLKLCTR